MRCILLGIFLLTAACGRSEDEQHIEDVMADPFDESAAKFCNGGEPCIIMLNEAGQKNGF